MINISDAAKILLEAEDNRRACEPLTSVLGPLDMNTAYAIQRETLKRRLARGEKLIGLKLGLTSRAKQIQMKVDVPIIAWLTDAMLVRDARLPANRLIHPRVEPEIVFDMGTKLKGPGVDADTARKAVATVRGGIEIIDSRFANFSFTLTDVIADNASAAGVVLGDRTIPTSEIDLINEQCSFEVDGKVVASATGAACLGDPAHALATAANLLASSGIQIESGWTIMTGGLTEAAQIKPENTVKTIFAHLGEIRINGG